MTTRKKIQTRKRKFEVPKEFVKTFLSHVEDTGLEYTLSEVDEDENLVIYVEYSSEEKDEIMNLIEDWINILKRTNRKKPKKKKMINLCL